MFIFVFSLQLVDWLAFPAIMLLIHCFRFCDVCSVLVYIDLCSDPVRGDACSIFLPTTWSKIFCSFFAGRLGGELCLVLSTIIA